MSLPFPVNLPKQRRRLEPALLSRAQGCMLGQLAGDALGSRVEFLDARTIRNRHGDGPSELQDGGTFNLIAGQPTDDSELALALARTLIRDGEFNQDAVFESYRAWFHSQPFDVGTTTSDGLSRKTPKAAGANATSEANGALMRVSPLGIAAVADLERAATWAAQDAVLTHPHPLCQEASSVFVRALGVGIAGGSRQDMYRAALDASTSWTRETLERASFAPPPEFVRHQGWVRIALHNAFYRLLHAPSLEAAIIETVREGGDTDTNAAIAGALCGAFHGREAVPPGWRRSLLSCRPTESYEASIRPRPAWCWPVDALEVAERLLTL